MSKPTLAPPTLRRDETILGWCYFAFQMTVLPGLLLALNGMLRKPLTDTEINFVFFSLNFLAAVWIYHQFLSASFKQVKSHPAEFIQGVVLGLAAYWACFYLISTGIRLVDPGYVNRNDASIADLSRGGYSLMLLGTVIMAPVAEECAFRGLMFRGLWRTSPAAAYLVSIAGFYAIHVVGFIGVYTPGQMLLAFFQYLPAGLCLGWCYVKSGSIYGPIVMHAIINFYGLNRMR